jgi:hypothetical protein
MLSFAQLPAKPKSLVDLERRDYAAFDVFGGLATRLRCPPIFSARLIKMHYEAVPFGRNELRKACSLSVLAIVSVNILRVNLIRLAHLPC